MKHGHRHLIGRAILLLSLMGGCGPRSSGLSQDPNLSDDVVLQSKDSPLSWYEKLERELEQQMPESDLMLQSNFDKPMISMLNRTEAFSNAAAQKIRAFVAIPIDPEYDPRVQAHYKAKRFAINQGPAFRYAPGDPIGPSGDDPKKTLQCPTTFLTLRPSFRIEGGKQIATVYAAHDHWVCRDMVMLPSEAGSWGSIDGKPAPDTYRGKCKSLLLDHVGSQVVRHCTQTKDALGVKPYQRTYVMGPFKATHGTSYLGTIASKQKDFKDNLVKYQTELSAGFRDLREDFRKTEVAYDKFYKTLPVTKEGRQMIAQHFAISTFAMATAGMDLPLWKDLLFKGGVFATIGAITEALDEQKYVEAGAEWLGFVTVSGIVDKNMISHIESSMQARAAASGKTAAPKLSPAAGNLIAGLAYVIGDLVVDYVNGELTNGNYAADSSIPEDVAERIVMAAIAVGTYVIATKFGPLAGILRSELTMLYYELHALGRYGYFFTKSAEQDKKHADYVSARHFAAKNDWEIIMASYGIYLKYLATHD